MTVARTCGVIAAVRSGMVFAESNRRTFFIQAE